MYEDGELVVDLWMGQTSPEQRWSRDTLAIMMSATKGVTTLAVQICDDRGVIDVDSTVASYWPEFAFNGKEGITVRQVLSHTAGLPVPVGYEDHLRFDGTGWDRVDEIVARLAASAPLWEPGTQAGYHALTFSWLLGEIVVRTTGMTLGAFIRTQICEPLQLDMWLGTPAAEQTRVATVIKPDQPRLSVQAALDLEQRTLDPKDPVGAALIAMDGENILTKIDVFMNGEPGRSVELGGSNGTGTARSLALMYQVLACDGEIDGTRLLSPGSVEKFTSVEFEGTDALLGVPTRRGLGYQLGTAAGEFGPGPQAFGHGGFGGQLGFADPERRLSAGLLRSRLESLPVLRTELLASLYR